MYEALGSVSRGRRLQRRAEEEGEEGRERTVHESALTFTSFPNGLVYFGRCKIEAVIVLFMCFKEKFIGKRGV